MKKHLVQVFDVIGDELFSSDPASSDSGLFTYVPSATYDSEIRQPVTDGSLLGRQLDARDLPSPVRGPDRLGPYERQLLAALLGSRNPLLLVRGGAGSGKSSTFRYLAERYCAGTRRASASDRESGEQPRPVHFTVDLNPIAHRAAVLESGETRRAVLGERVEDALADALQSALMDYFRTGESDVAPASSFLGALEQLVSVALGTVPIPSTRPFPLAHAVVRFSVELRRPLREGSDETSIRRVMAAAGRLQPYDRLELWLALLELVARDVDRSGSRLILTIDNVDPLSEYLQDRLVRSLSGVVSKASFKVVMPVRLSTFRTSHFAQPYTWYPHCGPNPVDVVTARLATYLSDPTVAGSHSALGADFQAVALCQAASLLLYLHHPASPRFADVLRSLSGTSIRRGLRLAHLVFSEGSLAFESAQASEMAVQARRLGRRLTALWLAERSIESARAELSIFAREAVRQSDGGAASGLSPAVAAERISRAVTASLRAIAGTPEVDSAILSLAQHRSVLSPVAPDGPTDAAGSTELESLPDGNTIAEIARHLASAPLHADSQLRRTVIRRVRDAVLQDFGLLGGRTDAGAVPEEPTDDTALSLPGVTRRSLRARSRDALRVCYSSSLVADVFHSVGARTPSMRKLRTLFTLGRSPQSRQVADLLSVHRAWSTSEDEVVQSLNELISPERDLVWLQKSHHYFSIHDVLEDAETPVSLSPTGWSYYHRLLSNVDYLSQMLVPERVEHADGLGSRVQSRLRQTIEALQGLHEQEIREASQAAWPEGDASTATRDAVVDALVMILDVVVRATRDFIATTSRLRFIAERDGGLDGTDPDELLTAWLSLVRRARHDWEALLPAATQRLDACSSHLEAVLHASIEAERDTEDALEVRT